MQVFDFGAFQIEMEIPSHVKILRQMLFGAFHIIPRSIIWTSEISGSKLTNIIFLDSFPIRWPDLVFKSDIFV